MALAATKSTILSGSIEDYPEGIILPIDKPYRWTSADVIRKLKFAACRHFSKKKLKVGHAGTLDPLATGLLIVCIGKATKMAEELQRHQKEYVAAVAFGATTPSYDLEKDVDRLYPYSHIDEAAVRSVLPHFLGSGEQIAPLFSAKSSDGVRAYELARKIYKQGGEFDHTLTEILSKQNIEISELELLDFFPEGIPPISAEENCRNSRINVADSYSLHLPTALLRVRCSKGTYIRALARDLGEALSSGAHLASLRRTVSGALRIDVALSVDEAMEMLK